MDNNTGRVSICLQCGAPHEHGSSACAFCGAAFEISKSACRIVLDSVGNHPSLIIQALQSIADDLFETGRGRTAMPVVRMINGLTGIRSPIKDPIVLFETDDRDEAEYMKKKLEENGARVIIE